MIAATFIYITVFIFLYAFNCEPQYYSWHVELNAPAKCIEVDNALYISVVDYKSSHKTLSVKDMYHGLMLQLLTYLDTAVHFSTELFGKQAKPAGAFFAQVKNPILQANKLIGKDLLEDRLKVDASAGAVLSPLFLLCGG